MRIIYDAQAIAYHDLRRDSEQFLKLSASIAANKVRLVTRHPDLLDEMFPSGRGLEGKRFLRLLPRGSTRAYKLMGTWAYGFWQVERRFSAGRSDRMKRLARAAWTLAGVACLDEDGHFIERLLT